MNPSSCAQLGKTSAQLRERRHEGSHVLVIAAQRRPIHPSDRIVLTIGVVIAALAVTDLISGKQQRHALRQHQACKQIATQLPSQPKNLGLIGCSLDTAVGAVIVVGTIAVVLAVRQIVLAVIAHEVGERKSIVNGDMIDARARAAAIVIEKIGGAGHATTKLTDDVAFARPVAPKGATKMVVPFRPARREFSDLVSSWPDVPRFGDQLDRGQRRILPKGGEEGSAAFKSMPAAPEGAGKIKPESIDATHFHPIPQRIHHHLQHAGMAEIECVDAAGEVVVIARLVRQEPVVRRIVYAAETQRWAEMIALSGMIVDDIEDDLDAGVMQARDGRTKLVERLVQRVARRRRKKAE